MHRSLTPMKFAALVILSLGSTGLVARGQEEKQGFRYAQPKATPKVAKSAPVVRGPAAPELIKRWEVNQSGEASDGLTPGVERIEWWSDGRVRWLFSVMNRNETRRGYLFDMKSSYVADDEGETYEVTGREFQNNHNQYYLKEIQSGTRFKFWLDYAVPRRATKAFKVGLVGEFTHNYARLKPFTVKLTEPIGGELELPPVAAGQAEEKGGLDLPEILHDEERTGGMTRATEPGRGVAPKPSSEAAQAVRAAPVDGRRYEGNIQGAAGGHSAGGILFERRSKDRLLSARLYEKSDSAKVTKLVGAIYEDITAPGGLVFRFEDREEVEYRFTLVGSSFSGTDTKGNHYAFMHKK